VPIGEEKLLNSAAAEETPCPFDGGGSMSLSGGKQNAPGQFPREKRGAQAGSPWSRKKKWGTDDVRDTSLGGDVRQKRRNPLGEEKKRRPKALKKKKTPPVIRKGVSALGNANSRKQAKKETRCNPAESRCPQDSKRNKGRIEKEDPQGLEACAINHSSKSRGFPEKKEVFILEVPHSVGGR